MTLGESVNAAIGAAGFVVAACAAFFAWRGWLRNRRIIVLQFSVERDQQPDGSEPWGLRITARCRRGTAWIGGLSVEWPRAGLAARGESPTGDTTHGITLAEGGEVSYFVSATEFAMREAHGRPRACWMDAEDRRHGTEIPEDMVARLLSADPGTAAHRKRRRLLARR